MSYIAFYTLLLFLTKVRSISRQSLNSQNLREIQTAQLGTAEFRNNLTKSFSESKFAHNKVKCSDRALKLTKSHLLNLKTTDFSIKNLGTCKHKLLSGFDKNVNSSLVLPWYFEVFRGIYFFLKRCQSDVDCYKKRIIRGMDRMMEMRSVKLAEGIFLVKDQDENISTMPRDSDDNEPFLIAVATRIIQVLETHALRVRLGIMKENVSQARIGHHGYKHAFPLMVGSFMLLASFMVPMGFQFLAVVGGKALVLSQIALVMAMGSTLQRFFGFGNQKQGNVGGVVQHEYYVRDDIQQPWQRQGSEDKHYMTYPHSQQLADQHQQITLTEQQLPDHHQQLTHQQLQGLMNYHQP